MALVHGTRISPASARKRDPSSTPCRLFRTDALSSQYNPSRAVLAGLRHPMDVRTATSVDKGHGRLEKRRITVSSLLASYSLWPGLAQVFKLERERTNALGETERETAYGITSLLTSTGTPTRLLALVREHWGSENGLHYRRDRPFREDDSQLRMGHAPHLLAILNNKALGLFARQGQTNLPHAQRTFAYQFDRVLALLAS